MINIFIGALGVLILIVQVIILTNVYSTAKLVVNITTVIKTLTETIKFFTEKK